MEGQAQVQDQAPVAQAAPVLMPNSPIVSPEIMAKLAQRNDANIMQSHLGGNVPELQQAAAQKAQTLPPTQATITAAQAMQQGLPLSSIGQPVAPVNGNTPAVAPVVNQPGVVPVVAQPTTPNAPNIFTKNGNGAPEFEGWGEGETNMKIGDYVKKQYAIDNPQTLFNSMNTWRADSRQLQEARTLADNLAGGIESLPPDLKKAMHQYNNGEDYRTDLNNSGGINFAMPFENHGKEKVVDYFNPNWREEARLEAKDMYGDDLTDDKLKLIVSKTETKLYNNSKTAFNQQKGQFDAERVRIQDEAALRRDSFVQSAQSSIDALKSTWPGFDEVESQNIHDILTKGDVNAIFFDSKGNYKSDAAERLAWTLHGSSREETAANQAARDAESIANANNLRQAGKKNVNSGSQNPNAAEQKGGEVSKMFQAHFKESPYAHKGSRSK